MNEHKTNVFGLEDVLLEAGLITSGSLNGVMMDKSHEWAMNCHKSVAVAWESFVMDKFLASKGKEEALVELAYSTKKKIESFIESPWKEILESLLVEEELETNMNYYYKFYSEIKKGSLGKTGQFWYPYWDYVLAHLTTGTCSKDEWLHAIHVC